MSHRPTEVPTTPRERRGEKRNTRSDRRAPLKQRRWRVLPYSQAKRKIGGVKNGRSPAVRARAVQDALAQLDTFKAGATVAARELVPAESLKLIDASRATEWIPIEHDHHVPSAVVETLGSEADAYFRNVLTRQLEAPLLRSTWTATQRLLGLSPASLFYAVRLGWPVIYRDFGSIRILPHKARAAGLRMSRVAAQVFEHPAYLTSFKGFFGGFLDVCKCEGEVELSAQPKRSTVEITVRWK